MKNIKLLFVSVLIVALCGTTLAQMKPKTNNKSSFTGQNGGGFKRFLTKTPWTFGLSGHVVDDDGNPFKKVFDVSKTWNFLYYPSRLTIDGYYQAGFSFQAEFAYSQIKAGKRINNEFAAGTGAFFSADAHLKYDLNELFGQTNWFDPYVTGGYGFTLRSAALKPTTITSNVGFGANFWLFENLGFNIQTVAKFAMIQQTSNYLHHSVGVVYKIEGGHGSRPGRLGKRYKFVGKTSRR
jgi:OmpA-OmpF porin, OOP family